MNRATYISTLQLSLPHGSSNNNKSIHCTDSCMPRPAKYSVRSARGWMKMLALQRIFCCSQRRFLFILNQVQCAHFSFMKGYLLQIFHFLKPNRGLVLDQCSQGPMFPGPCVLHINIGKVPKFPGPYVPMFLGAMVPKVLSYQGLGWGTLCEVCPVPRTSFRPMFPRPYVPRALCSPD